MAATAPVNRAPTLTLTARATHCSQKQTRSWHRSRIRSRTRTSTRPKLRAKHQLKAQLAAAAVASPSQNQSPCLNTAATKASPGPSPPVPSLQEPPVAAQASSSTARPWISAVTRPVWRRDTALWAEGELAGGIWGRVSRGIAACEDQQQYLFQHSHKPGARPPPADPNGRVKRVHS